MNRAIVVAVLLGGGIARAQEPAASAPKAADDGYADRTAADLYEQAIRADAVGKHLMAQQLATQALTVSPDGRYAPEVRRFLSRGTSELLLQQPPIQENHTGARAAYVLSAGLVGATAGFFASWGALFQSQGDGETLNGGAVGGFMLAGAVVGVAASLASMSGVTDGSLSLHLWAGATFGAWIATSVVILAQSGDFGGAGEAVGGGIAAGAIIDAILAATAKLTPGDGAASLTIGNIASLAAVGFEAPYVNASTLAVSMLVVSALGFVGGEVLNSSIHWSGARWGLIFLSAVLGIAMGTAIAAAAGSGSAVPPILAIGGLVGFGIGAAATTGMEPGTNGAAPPPEALATPRQAPRALFSLAF